MRERPDWPEAVVEARGVTGPTGLAMLLVCGLLMAVVMPAELRHALAWLVHGILSGHLSPEARAVLPSLCLGAVGVVAFVVPGLVGGAHRTRVGLRWRGSDVRISRGGVTVGRGEHARNWGWEQIARIPLIGAEFVVVTRTGERIAIPQLAFDRPATRVHHLKLMARAYRSAALRGLETALDDPPRLYAAYRQRSPRPPWVVWLGLACLAVGCVSMGLALALMPDPASSAEGIAALGSLVVVLPAGLALLRWMAKSQQKSSLRIDEHGIEVRGAKGRQLYPWEQLSAMWRLYGRGATDVAVRVNGRRIALPGVRLILRANLAAFAHLQQRTTRQTGTEMLLACYRYYKGADASPAA